jgi:hypothetical protein
MIKILVPVAADLASSIALRYACQMSELIQVEIQTIHVKAPSSEGSGSQLGTGWVRHTWEKTMLTEAEDEIAQLIRAERTHCPSLGEPLIMIGDRDEKILRELQRGFCDLFVEGTIPTFSSSYFSKRLESNLYQDIPCPFLMVKNLIPLRRVVLILSENVDPHKLVQVFTGTFGESNLKVELFYLKSADSAEQESGGLEEMTLQATIKALDERGWVPEKSQVISGQARELAADLEDHGLLLTGLDRHLKRKTFLHEFLVATPAPILLFWQ